MSKDSPKIIAIDGPAGSGKSTIAALTSQKLGWDYLNTGALYRLVAYLAKKNQLSISDDVSIGELIKSCEKDLIWHNGCLIFKGQNLSEELRDEEIGQNASAIARSALIRQLLIPIQRTLASHVQKGMLIDGRDIGTVVFPQADIKIFMTANLTTRAERRYKQLKESGLIPLPNFQDLLEGLRKRDEQDEKRAVAPLQKAVGAIEFNTDSMTIDQCVTKLASLIQEHLQS